MYKRRKKVLLTGSGGFLGTFLKSFLEQKNMSIVPFDVSLGVSYDVRKFDKVSSSMHGVDGVIHMASISRPKDVFARPLEAVDINIRGMLNILEASRVSSGKPWVIFISSREVFGDNPEHPVTEKTKKESKDLYVVCKIACEELCKLYSANHDIKTRVLRFSNLYTSRHDYLNRVIPNLIISAAGNTKISITGRGNELFDFVHIKDAVQAIYKTVKDIEGTRANYDDFNIISGETTTLPQIAKLIIEKLNSKSSIETIYDKNINISNFRGDYSKARKVLGYNPRISLSRGIDHSIKEFREADII